MVTALCPSSANLLSLNWQEVRDLTGYRIRKCLTYKKDQIISGSDQSTTGCIIYRGVEAYLNYLEAYYLRNGKVDGKAAQYWTAIRKRGGVDTDYEKTIRNTDMSKEVDWAKYSGSTLVDATLFNIRRERRCEFIGEGMRWDRPDALESYGSVAHNQIYSGRIQLLG